MSKSERSSLNIKPNTFNRRTNINNRLNLELYHVKSKKNAFKIQKKREKRERRNSSFLLPRLSVLDKPSDDKRRKNRLKQTF